MITRLTDRLEKHFAYVLCAAFLLVGAMGATAWQAQQVGAAGSADFSLTPSSGTHIVGNGFTVTVYVDSGDQKVNAVEPILTFDSNALQVTNVDGSTSGFNVQASIDSGTGYVALPRGTMKPLSGKQKVASVTFRVLAATNTSSINFRSDSGVYQSSQNIWNQQDGGGQFSLVNAVSNPSQPQQSSTSGGSSQSSGGGTSNNSGSESSQTQTSGNAQQNTATTTTDPTGLSQTEYLVVIKILDNNGEPIKDATVRLDTGEVTKTDDKGLASFVGITPGQRKVTVEHKGKSESKTVIITPQSDPSQNLQEFEVQLAAESTSGAFIPLYIGLLVGGVIVLGLLARPVVHHFAKRQLSRYTDPNTIVVGDMSKKTMPPHDSNDSPQPGAKQ